MASRSSRKKSKTKIWAKAAANRGLFDPHRRNRASKRNGRRYRGSASSGRGNDARGGLRPRCCSPRRTCRSVRSPRLRKGRHPSNLNSVMGQNVTLPSASGLRGIRQSNIFVYGPRPCPCRAIRKAKIPHDPSVFHSRTVADISGQQVRAESSPRPSGYAIGHD